MLFNLVFSLGLIFFTGTFKRMETESYEEFAIKANGDLRNLNKLFEAYAMNAAFMANNIDERLRSLASRNDIPPRDLNSVATETALGYALTGMLLWSDANRVSGAYFMLCGEAGTWRYPGVYIRLSEHGSGYEYEIGPPSIMDRNGVYASTAWKSEIMLTSGGEDSDFLRRLTGRKYNGNVASRADGYWSPPHRALGGSRSSISFSVPLLDDDNRAYAIFGIVLDASFVAENMLPPSTDKFSTRYALVPIDAGSEPPKWVVSASDIYSGTWAQGPNRLAVSEVALPAAETVIDNFDTMFEGKRRQISAVSSEIDLYPPDSPFANDRWALVGFADRGLVLRNYRVTLFLTVLSIVLAAIVAGALVFAIARRQLRQISLLSSSVDANMLTGAATELGKTNIAEIDHLANVLEDMQKSVTESALRVSAIFDLLEMPMGSYEVRTGSARVFVTPSLKKILDLDYFDDSMYLELEQWDAIYARLKASPFEDEDNVYRWYSGEGNDRMKLLRIEEVCRYDSTIGIVTDVTDHLHKNLELEFQANYDSLTRLYNRRLFRQKVVKRIRRQPDACGIMLFGDLDGLKQVNDVYGHVCGDELIKAAAEMMATLQQVGGITSRLSGDEFAAYVHGFASKEEGVAALKRHMDEHFDRTIRLGELVEKPVSMSRGMACYPSDSNDFSNLLTFADYAMYQAKHSNKGSVRVFDRDDYLNDAVLHRKNEALVEVVEKNRMSYVFQPMYDILRERVWGYTAYMRPQIEEFADPKGLLEIAVIADKQAMLERRIFRNVLSRMQQEGIDANTIICVKTIKNYVLDDETLSALKEEYGPCFRSLVVLISADSVLDNEITERKVRAYRAAGAGIAFEGFGDSLTDSLEMLRMMPDMVKINVSLIRDAESRPDSQLKLGRIVSECEQNGTVLVAMGIETERDFMLAKKMGFDVVQGYYVGRPEPEFERPIWERPPRSEA